MKNATQKVAHNVEYDEAPSGHVTFYNYKEPLMKFSDGHGYVGALLFDGYSGKVQCHLCGEWFEALSGNHLAREHSMDAEQYKKVVGLNKGSALVSEKYRASLIARGLESRKKNLVNQTGRKRSAATRARISETLKENRDEQKNIRGTCPEQLIDRLVALYRKHNRTPTTKEITFIEALEATYGSLKEACMVAGIPYRNPGETLRTTKYTPDYCINFTRDFYDKEGKLPLAKDMPEILRQKYKSYGIAKIQRLALSMDGRYRRTEKRFRYTKDDLINFLRAFDKINGRKPSHSDCKRGILPHQSRYVHNFGSWKNALSVAFPGYVPVRVFRGKKREVKPVLPPSPLSLRQRYNLSKKRVAKRIAAKRELSMV